MKYSLAIRFTLYAVAFAASINASAQSYPAKPVRLVVSGAAGGAIDLTARAMGERLSPLLGQAVIVENRPGANALLGHEYVAKSAPDGYTLAIGTGGPLVITPLLEPDVVRFNSREDFVPVSRLMLVPVVLAVAPPLGISSFKELRSLLLSQPDKYSFAFLALGTVSHTSATYLAQLIGAKVLPVPYKGITAALPDITTGRVSMVIDAPTTLAEHIRAKKLVGIAALTKVRIPGLDIPTIGEAGLPEMMQFEWGAWSMVLAPKGTPGPVVERLNRDIVGALKDPGLQTQYAQLFALATPTTLAETRTFLDEQLKLWPPLFQSMGLLKSPPR
ncbi:MAG: Bug family tripartite tricarboxylate transporter substrate binding protein [Burkholderiales bacterium]